MSSSHLAVMVLLGLLVPQPEQFNQLFADLVMIPALRMVFLPLLHNAPSEELAEALTKLQQSVR